VTWRALAFAAALLVAGAAQAQLRPGQPVPPFDTQLLDGKTLPAAALKGKVVLVVFWATWCPACQRELPQLQKLYESHRARGLEIVALSVDADRFTVEEFWKDHEYTFPVALRGPAQAQAFGPIKGTPTLFLFDRRGILRMAHLGGIGGDALRVRLQPLLEQ